LYFIKFIIDTNVFCLSRWNRSNWEDEGWWKYKT